MCEKWLHAYTRMCVHGRGFRWTKASCFLNGGMCLSLCSSIREASFNVFLLLCMSSPGDLLELFCDMTGVMQVTLASSAATGLAKGLVLVRLRVQDPELVVSNGKERGIREITLELHRAELEEFLATLQEIKEVACPALTNLFFVVFCFFLVLTRQCTTEHPCQVANELV